MRQCGGLLAMTSVAGWLMTLIPGSRPCRRLASMVLACCSFIAAADEPDWSAYARVLAKHAAPGARNDVPATLVDYAALRQDPDFDRALDAIAKFPARRLTTTAERLAFNINAYNLLALATVVTHWPVEGIRDIGSWIRPVWKRPAGLIGGRTVSLDELEHDILRRLGEPRIHFAIVCASLSCPDLRLEPYTAARLDAQLDDQVRGFLANEAKGLRFEGRQARVSKIFDWFAEDFAGAGGVAAFVRRYRSLPADVAVAADLDYDWSVNAR
jgi:hypothetical protein